MKTVKILMAAVAMVSLTVVSCGNESLTVNVNEAENTAIDVIMTRTSIRSFTEQAVDSADVNTLLQAAMAAPTAGNKQPWKMVVVDDESLLDSLAEQHRPIASAPLAIVLCGDTTNVFPGEGKDFWIQDVSAATENLLLAAHSLGLGAVWCGVYPISERVAAVKVLLALPDEIVPLCVVAVGHPAESPEPKDKWKPENVHYNGW